MRTRRNEIIVLAALGAVLAAVVYWNGRRSIETPGVAAADVKYQPLKIENPSLRLDLLERIQKFEYTGGHRNIFSASLPPPPRPKVDAAKVAPTTPPGPPPLVVPLQYFGYTTDARTGRRRAFFTNGDDVYIVNEGDTLLSRFRVVKIKDNAAELEEISSGRRTTVTLETQGPSV